MRLTKWKKMIHSKRVIMRLLARIVTQIRMIQVPDRIEVMILLLQVAVVVMVMGLSRYKVRRIRVKTRTTIVEIIIMR